MDTKISGLTVSQAALAADLFTLVSGGVNKQISGTNLQKMFANLPNGTMFNGKIVPSVTSNNLTVALKTFAGNDPSATDPVSVIINSTIYVITSALSITLNAGTKWFNSGSAELATNEIDYFVYLGYNSTDGVVIGVSRIPYGKTYGDFNTTNTNEQFCAISTITHAAASDPYVVIGRFAATLSAGAGYTWTVPTYTADNLIQRPIYETRWLTWTPTISGFSSNPTTVAIYLLREGTIFWILNNTTTGTSNATTATFTTPFTSANLGFVTWSLGRGQDNGAEASVVCRISSNSTLLEFFKGPGITAFTNTGTKFMSAEGFYRLV